MPTDDIKAYCFLGLGVGCFFLPASIYRLELMDTPIDRLQIGFGRKILRWDLIVLREFLDSTDVTPAST